MLFSFKGITGAQFKTAVQASTNYDEVGTWLPASVASDQVLISAGSLMKIPEKRSYFIESCSALGLNPQMNSTFDWLEADDRETFRRKSP
jgi:hypothetical protein